MTRTEKTQQMLAHVAAQEQSGTSRKSYCQQHAVNLNVLNYWCGKSKRPPYGGAHGQGFAQVQVSSEQGSPSRPGGGMELHYPNGVRLLLPANTALEQVAACIRLY